VSVTIDRRPIVGLTIEQQRGDTVMGLLLCGEARGEQDAGGNLEAVAMAAVYWCCKNRQQKSRWLNLSLREIALQPWQFSCFNKNDPNREKLLDLWKTDPVTWERADTVCDLVETGYPDPTRGATHYCTKSLWGTSPVGSAKTQWYHKSEIDSGRTRMTVQIGGHVFAVAP